MASVQPVVGRTGKLVGEYHDAICRQAAMGTSYAQITRMLGEGLETGSGSVLASRHVTAAAVKQRVNRDKERVQSWRLKLYGEVDSRLSVQPGWRLDQLEKLLRQALLARAHAKGQQARGWSSEARMILGEIRKELDFLGLATSQAVAHQHLHLHGERPQMIAGLARGLAGALAAGGGDRVVKLLGSLGLEGTRARGTVVDGQIQTSDPPKPSAAAVPPNTVSPPAVSLTVLEAEILDPATDPDLELELEPDEGVDVEALAAASIF